MRNKPALTAKCCSRLFGARVRFLCKRKNSFNIRRHNIVKCEVRRRWKLSHPSVGSVHSFSKCQIPKLDSLQVDGDDSNDSSFSADEEETSGDAASHAAQLDHDLFTQGVRCKMANDCQIIVNKSSSPSEIPKQCSWKSKFSSFFCSPSKLDTSSSCSSDDDSSDDDDWDTSGFSSPSDNRTAYEDSDILFAAEEATVECSGQFFPSVSHNSLCNSNASTFCCEEDFCFPSLNENSCEAFMISDIEAHEPLVNNDDEDEIDGACKVSSINFAEINERWNKAYNMSMATCSSGVSGGSHARMVQFSDQTSVVTVPNAIEWAEDYTAARRGSWVQDQLHFNRRIKDTEEQISWVLSSSHRNKIISSLQNL